jgi:hypothetical protein
MTAIRLVGPTLSLTAFLAIYARAQADYGVDCSFPIHSKEFTCGNLLGDRKKVYEDFMDGCRKRYGSKASRCDSTEDDRIEMSLRQPQSMVVSQQNRGSWSNLTHETNTDPSLTSHVSRMKSKRTILKRASKKYAPQRM